MPKARNRFQRCSQVLRWMEDKWPCGRKVNLVWKKEVIDEEDGAQLFGQTYRKDRHLVIELSERKNRDWITSLSTLRHEYVHCVLWGVASVEHSDKISHHPNHFYSLLGEIENTFEHLGGHEESSSYSAE